MDQTIGLLEAIAENTEMGKNTLAQLLKMTDDAPLSAELQRQQSVYHDINARAHAAMTECGSAVRGQTKWAKAMTHMGICMETIKDKSTPKIAEMLIEGSNKGILDCAKSRADYPQASQQAQDMALELEKFQQDSIERLKPFLG